jgi:hypothetical protein
MFSSIRTLSASHTIWPLSSALGWTRSWLKLKRLRYGETEKYHENPHKYSRVAVDIRTGLALNRSQKLYIA